MLVLAALVIVNALVHLFRSKIKNNKNMGVVEIVSDAIITRRLANFRRCWFLHCQLRDRLDPLQQEFRMIR